LSVSEEAQGGDRIKLNFDRFFVLGFLVAMSMTNSVRDFVSRMAPLDEFPVIEKREFVLCFPPSRAALAHALAADGAGHFYLNPVKVAEFSDGEPNVVIPHLHRFTRQHVLYIADWSKAAVRYLDMCALIPMAELGPASLTIVVPFFGTATMEREVFEGSVATANVDAKLLSRLPGTPHVITIDLHTQQNQFFYHDCVVSLHSTMPFARNIIIDQARASLSASKKPAVVVAFPDDGAHKRFAAYFDDCDIAICAKVRDGDKRRVQLNDGDVKGKDVLIVDDLVRSGGTLIECAKVLKQCGALSIKIFVPHACFPKGEYVKFVDGENAALIDKFYITDSVTASVDKIRALNSPKFEIISLAKILLTLLN
jgi:ribose-phosphate pyrophosphokinase